MTSKLTKNQNVPIFNVFMGRLSNYSIDFVDKNDENAQHGSNSLSSRLFRKANSCFPSEKDIKLTQKTIKNRKFSFFQSFYAVVVKFSTDFVDWNIEKGKKERMCPPVGFSEEFIAAFYMKNVPK